MPDMEPLIEYASPQQNFRPFWPWWLAPVSLSPPAFLIFLIFVVFRHGFGNCERLVGALWMIFAVMSVAWLVVFARRRRSAFDWAAIALHLSFVGVTIFPGYLAIQWLMHWMTGPGA
jgi:hypothetical protein